MTIVTTSNVRIATLKLHHKNHKEDVRINYINQPNLSYHLMRHDASGKKPGLTLDDEDICDIVMGGGCYNLPPADTPTTMRMMIGNRLVGMLSYLFLIRVGGKVMIRGGKVMIRGGKVMIRGGKVMIRVL
jgi:hypothetical protein